VLRKVLIAAIALAPLAAAADKPNPDILALQRDVAILQETVKGFQASVSEKLTQLQTEVQNSVDAARQATAAASGVQRVLEQELRDQQGKLLAPVQVLGTHVDGIAGEVRTMQQGLSDLVAVINKLQTQLTDLNNAVRVMQAPVAPPAPTAPASATDLFNSAEGDRMQGKFDLALQEYSEFLKWYGDTGQASQAQYQIAQIRYAQKDFEAAAKEFDTLIQKYPENARMPEALYYKGMSLKELGRANQAADAFTELRKRFPSHTLAKQSVTKR
jgi:TolA-binding protein